MPISDIILNSNAKPKRTQTVGSSTQKYLDDVNQGLNSQFRQLNGNNPFTEYSYNPTAWDKLGNVLGFHTQEDKLRYQYELEAKKYAAQLQQNQREEDFNSPLSQVMRMRQAGLNPDLTDGVSSGQATEFDNQTGDVDLSGVETSASDVVSAASSLVSTALGSVGTVMDLIQKSSDIKIKKNDERLSSLGLSSSIIDTAKKIVEEFYPSLSEEIRSDPEKLVSALTEHVSSLNLSNKDDEASLLHFVTQYANSPEFRTQFEELLARGSEAYTTNQDTFNNPAYGNYLDVPSGLTQYNEVLNKLFQFQIDATKFSLGAQIEENKYNKSYFKILNEKKVYEKEASNREGQAEVEGLGIDYAKEFNKVSNAFKLSLLDDIQNMIHNDPNILQQSWVMDMLNYCASGANPFRQVGQDIGNVIGGASDILFGGIGAAAKRAASKVPKQIFNLGK